MSGNHIAGDLVLAAKLIWKISLLYSGSFPRETNHVISLCVSPFFTSTPSLLLFPNIDNPTDLRWMSGSGITVSFWGKVGS